LCLYFSCCFLPVTLLFYPSLCIYCLQKHIHTLLNGR
jgi:hypothetical protein